MITPATKLGNVKYKVVEAATAAALQTALLAVQAAAADNQRFLDVQYRVYDSSHYSALIVYTE